MRALGQTPTDQELKEIMDDFDENRDGVISFEEFLGLMVVLINKVDEVRGFLANCNTFKHPMCHVAMHLCRLRRKTTFCKPLGFLTKIWMGSLVVKN